MPSVAPTPYSPNAQSPSNADQHSGIPERSIPERDRPSSSSDAMWGALAFTADGSYSSTWKMASQPEADLAIWTIRMEPGARWTLPAATGEGTRRSLYFFKGRSVSVAGQTVDGHAAIELRGDAAVELSNGDETSGRFAYDGLDRALHEKARLGILTSLVANPDGLKFVAGNSEHRNAWSHDERPADE